MNTPTETAPESTTTRKTRVVIATTVALSFISFWQAGAIVLSDLASSMFYCGGIAERAIGKSAPWFVLAVMVFSFAVRSVLYESCSLYVRGGLYVVVREAMGPFMAKLSVAALIFDYLLTGPISSVSAGHYIAGLVNEVAESLFHLQTAPLDPKLGGVLVGLSVTVYFWRSNIRGLHESSQRAVQILKVTTIMVGILLVWCPITLLLQDKVELPPLPVPSNLTFNSHAWGWIDDWGLHTISSVAMFVAFGHAFLSMSGFETLAQVYREIAYPKMQNLKRTGNLVCFYALLSTGLITMFAVMIIPDAERPIYVDNLIGGLVVNLKGPHSLKIAFHAFVVLIGAAILSGAVNTSMIGANSVLNRVAEDNVLHPWFRKPHKDFGTTFRIINLIGILQVVTILLSRGDVYLLGEAYAFGVIWSLFLKSLGVLMLRVRKKGQENQDYRVPGNVSIAGKEIPVGLGAVTFSLLVLAVAILLSKEIATIGGLSFTLLLLIVFILSEQHYRRHHADEKKGLEEFNIDPEPEIGLDTVHVKAGSTIVAVRHFTSLAHLQWTLDTTRGRHRQIIVATIRPVTLGSGEYDLSEEQYFTSRERELFSHVVQMAEKAGKHVELLVIPSVTPYDGLVQTASNLKCSLLVTGSSPRMSNDELARRIGLAWERTSQPRHPFSLSIVGRGKEPLYVTLGPHSPRLWPEDVELAHSIWLRLTGEKGFGSKLHHRDVLGFALLRLAEELEGDDQDRIVQELRNHLGK